MRRAPKPEGRPTPIASRRSTLASASRLMSAVRAAAANSRRDRYGGTNSAVTCRPMIRALLRRARSAHAKQMRAAKAARILKLPQAVSAAHPKRSEGGVQTLRRGLIVLVLVAA